MDTRPVVLKVVIIFRVYCLKIMTILRTTGLVSNFTGSYIKKEYVYMIMMFALTLKKNYVMVKEDISKPPPKLMKNAEHWL